MLTSPIVTRLYTPKDFGVYGLMIAFIGFVTVISSLRYETAIVASESISDAAYLVIGSISISMVCSGLSSVCLYLMIKLKLLGFGELPFWSPFLIFLMCFATAVFFILRYWLIRIERFDGVRKVTIYQNMARSLGQVGLGDLQFGAAGLLWGECLGRLFGISRVIRDSLPILKEHFTLFQYSVICAVFKKYREFPLYSLPSAVLDSLSIALLLPIIAQLYGSQEAGQLALVQRVISIPALLIGGTIADSFHHQMATDSRNGIKELTPLFFRVAFILTLLGATLGGFLAFLAPLVFKLVFGEAWVEAGDLAARMSPMVAAGLVVSPLSRIVLVFNGQKYKLIYDLLALIILLSSLCGGRYLGKSFLISMTGFSLLNTFAFAIYFLILLYIISSHERHLRKTEFGQAASII